MAHYIDFAVIVVVMACANSTLYLILINYIIYAEDATIFKSK